jgi:TonB family protein
MQNLAALRYAYNKRLREKPGLGGKITVKFAIDEFGTVIFCQIVDTNMGDPTLEQEVVSKIKRWAFGKIDKPGDVTEVIYPFAFTQ